MALLSLANTDSLTPTQVEAICFVGHWTRREHGAEATTTLTADRNRHLREATRQDEK
jgi:hypothetical protein